MSIIFIAGTDTGAGKTVVTGLLAHHLAGKGRDVVTQKWVQTGNAASSNDIRMHLRLMGKRKEDFTGYMSLMAPYKFNLAASPHLAARAENRSISPDKIKRSLDRLAAGFDTVIIEGTGGLLVPINKKELLIDIVKRFRLPVLLVADNRLGAINHVLLSIEALKSRGINILGLIFNNISKNGDTKVLKDNPRIVESLTNIKVLGELPYSKDIGLLRRQFAPIANRIMGALWKTG